MIYTITTKDKQDHYMAFHGPDFYFVLWDLDQEFRNHLKHNPENLNKKQIQILQKVRDKLYELMEEHGVDFNHVS